MRGGRCVTSPEVDEMMKAKKQERYEEEEAAVKKNLTLLFKRLSARDIFPGDSIWSV